jgi:hypothetical protein
MAPGFAPTELVIHPDVDIMYTRLRHAAEAGQKPQQGMWKAFETAQMMIRRDGQWGDVIRSDQIPRYFRDAYNVTNLYCIDLGPVDRCFYTIVGRVVIFLDIVDHDTYDDWFPPKGQKKRRK